MLLTLDLPLKQLAYTSFSDVGFKLLTSEQIPLQIQQTFLKQVVDRYSSTYKPKSLSFRAVYLLQVTLKQWLFGWLYYDKLNDNGQNHIPYFICYYLAEPLHTLRLEKICLCLQKGPVELIDLHSTSVSLKPLILKDLHLYQEARPGVVIPWKIREQIYTAFKQEKLIDVFISANEQQEVIELETQIQPQEVTTKNKIINDNSFLPLIPVNEKQGVIELDAQVQPQEVVAKNKSINDNYLQLSKNSIFLIGIGFGATTIIGVVVLICVFFYTKFFYEHQLTQPPDFSRDVEKLK